MTAGTPVPPRVTYLLSDLGGGTGHHLFALLNGRRDGAWDARIVSEAENTARHTAPVALDVLPPGRRRRYPLAQIERLRILRKRFRRQPPDILHTYFFWSILYGRILKMSGVVPRLIENREDLGFNWGRHEYALLRLTRSAPDCVICVSEAVRQAVLQREGLPAVRTLVIRNGVQPPTDGHDLSEMSALRDEFGIPAAAPIVGMVANFNRPVKGAVYYVDALAQVAASMPDVRFLLIGLGDNQEELQARADAAGVGANLVFTGFRDDVGRLYELMDVSALTSLSEGLSITILESMRYGVPVVATEVGGNSEVVREGETGFLVPPRDPDAFAERVVRLLRDPELRRRFGASGREAIRQDFALSSVADEYARVYAGIMDRVPDSDR